MAHEQSFEEAWDEALGITNEKPVSSDEQADTAEIGLEIPKEEGPPPVWDNIPQSPNWDEDHSRPK